MKLLNLADVLQHNSYPGRGIILGRTADNMNAVAAYFVMGRSANSRNRVFIESEDGIEIEAAVSEKLEDPSLIIYHPVRITHNKLVISNGDHTESIRDALAAGDSYIEALRSRCFEPDSPNYTPRITGILDGKTGNYCLSILKSCNGDPTSTQRFFYEYSSPLAGQGHFLHTYQGDGSPLPSFQGEPEAVVIDSASPAGFAHLIWNSLNEENKVALYVSYMNLESGEADSMIVNKYTKLPPEPEPTV